MSLASELKRRLESDDRPINKRLKLAENVLNYPFFPTINREEIVIQWLKSSLNDDNIKNDHENVIATLKQCVKSINFKTISLASKNELFTTLSQFLLHTENENIIKTLIDCHLNVVENPTAHLYFQHSPLEIFCIFKNILEKLSELENADYYVIKVKRSLDVLIGCIKNSRKKAAITNSFLESGLLLTLFKYGDNNEFAPKILNIFQHTVFLNSSSEPFRTYLLALIRKSNLSTLFQEKGETLRPIVTIMDMILKHDKSSFPESYIKIFLKFFTITYKFDLHLIFIFNIFLYQCLGIDQDYINISENIKKFDISMKQALILHLENLKYFTEHNVNINVKLVIIEDDKTKKSFFTFLQHITNTIIHNNKINCTVLSIVKQTFLLEPEILESILETILPNILIQKTKYTNEYDDTLVSILEIMYKMSRGIDFSIKVLPNLKLKLESIDEEQKKLLNDRKEEKGLSHNDIFSNFFCDNFGKLASDLMTWQYIELFNLLVNYLNDFCIKKMNNNSLCPSIILLTEVLCSLISSLCNYGKIADQNIPESVYRKFENVFKFYEENILSEFGTNLQNFPNEQRLFTSFLNVCKSYGQLKLLLWQFQHHFNMNDTTKIKNKYHISDITNLHSYISSNVWKNLYKSILNFDNTNCIYAMNELILQNSVIELYFKDKSPIWNNCTKNHILNNLIEIWPLIRDNELYFNIVITNLSQNEINLSCQKLINIIINDGTLEKNYICSNKNFLSSITTACTRNIWHQYDTNDALKKYTSLYESSDLNNFDIRTFLNALDDKNNYMDTLVNSDLLNDKKVRSELEMTFKILNNIPVHHLKENDQNSVLFCALIMQTNLTRIESLGKHLLNIKNICTSILVKIFDLSYKLLNVFDIFPPHLFILLIERDYFKLICKDNKFNMFYFLKQILLGMLTKDNLNNLENSISHFSTYFKNVKKSKDVNVIMNNNFQALNACFNVLSTVKRTNLPLDSKNSILDHLTNMKSDFMFYFEKTDWKTMNEQFDKLDEKSAYLNLLPTYSIIISNNISDIDAIKRIGNALDFYIKLTLEELKNTNINTHHAKGCCSLMSVIIKNYYTLKSFLSMDEGGLTAEMWRSIKYLLAAGRCKIGNEWSEINNSILENITSMYEQCSVKIFNSFLMKELLQCSNLIIEDSINDSLSVENVHIVKSVWTCCLNANFKVTGKTEARSAAVKHMVKNFLIWLKNGNVYYINKRDDIQKEHKNDVNTDDSKKMFTKEIGLNKNMILSNICFEVISEFVAMKKIILSNNIFDSIIQIPFIVNLDTKTSKTQNSDEILNDFCIIYEKCLLLLNNLIIYRSELLQDRLPVFFQSYRRLISNLCIKSNSDHTMDKINVEKLTRLSLGIEKLTEIIVKNGKQDVSRIASYIVADIVTSFQKVSIFPSVKFHLQNCIYCLMQLLDGHAIGFLMRNMPDATRIMFQTLYDNYKKYYKYVGSS